MRAGTRWVVVGVSAAALMVSGVGLYAHRHGGLLAMISRSGDDLGGLRGGRGRRPFVGVGSVSNNSGVGGDDLRTAAREAIDGALQASDVVTTAEASSGGQRGARVRGRGHFLDANIQSIRPGNNSVRVEVSVVVSSYPGRAYEFESSSAITITGGSATTPAAQTDGVRRAMESATRQAVNQIAQGVP
jgi:hypothetical protein